MKTRRAIRSIVAAYDTAFGRGAAWNDLQAAIALAALVLWGLSAIGAIAIVTGGGHD